MDPLEIIALAEGLIKIANALLNASIATRSAIEISDIKASAARLASLKQASDDLSAKAHDALQVIIAKGST